MHHPLTDANKLAKLEELGLTEYAARAYLALLETGSSTARDVSAQSKVPMGKIYRALDELHVAGLVIVTPDNPKRYAPASVDQLVTRRQREMQTRILTLEHERKDLRNAFPLTNTRKPATGLGDVSLKKGRFNIVQAIIDGIRASHEDVLYLAGSGFLASWRWYEEELRTSLARGVRFRFLLAEEPCDADARGLAAYGEIRLRPHFDPTFGGQGACVVLDRERAFLASFVEDASGGQRDISLSTDQEGLTQGLASMAEEIWASSTSYAVEKRTAPFGEDPDPRGFPSHHKMVN